jgi:hypothetical protein
MTILFWGLTIGVLGKVLLAISVIMVHGKIVHEHKIDGAVIKEMKHEKNLAIGAVVLVLLGYLLEVIFYGFVPGIPAVEILQVI